jgi:uncharacterized protein (DUF2384 family)
MLANYDAKAVAAVMGIAFLRGDESRPSRSWASRRFVFSIDDCPVRIVAVTAGNTLAEFDASGGRAKSVVRNAHRIRPPSAVLIEKATENGLPRPVLRHVAEQVAGDNKAEISALEWAVVPKTTLERRLEQLSPQESERTERIAPHPQLDERSPIEAAKTDLGTRRTEQILNALEYGLAL